MRKWIGLTLAILGIACMIVLIFAMARGLVGFMSGMGRETGEPDPMYDLFPSELSRETRPPELMEDGDGAERPRDMSDSWIYNETSPVELTPGELSGETQG